MNNRQLIVQALDYIESELKSPLSIQILSRATGYSLYHFIRLFQGITGITPGDYIARRKITEAALDILRRPKRSFQDISLDYHFNDYETFTRSFKRVLHTTPTLLRNQHNTSMLPLMHRLRERDLLHLPAVQGTVPQVLELGAITLQGPIVNVTDDYSGLSQAWNQLFSRISGVCRRKQPEQYYQVGYWPDDYENSGVSFMCGCAISSPSLLSAPDPESANTEHVDADFSIRTLPAAKYLRFTHTGLSRDVSYTYKYIYETWLPKSEYRLSIPFEFEYYGEQYLGPNNDNSVSEIYVPIELL
ncbi:Right origin-binding protein [compost metagenome]